MIIPLTVNDFTLLLAILSATLLLTSEIINPQYSEYNFVLDKNRMRTVGSYLSYVFIFMVIIRLYQLVLSV